jgi:hypothetical protein
MSIFSDIDAEHHREILKQIIKKHENDLKPCDAWVKIVLEKILQEFNQECVE